MKETEYYLPDYHNRLNIQQIKEFLLYGTELLDKDTANYHERMLNNERNLNNIIAEIVPDKLKQEEFIIFIHNYMTEIKDIYMEMGMKSGATIVSQLLDIPKNNL